MLSISFDFLLSASFIGKVLVVIIYICLHKQINFFIVAVTGKARMQLVLNVGCRANDYLMLNDFYLPIGENRYKHIDTMIFANKYIYIVKEVKQIGEVKVSLTDQKWRVINRGKLSNIDNPIIYNQSVINNILRITKGIEPKDIKNVVVLSKTCKFDHDLIKDDNNYIFIEDEAIKGINKIERESNEDIMIPSEVERYCKAFYEYGLEADKVIKAYKKKNGKK